MGDHQHRQLRRVCPERRARVRSMAQSSEMVSRGRWISNVPGTEASPRTRTRGLSWSTKRQNELLEARLGQEAHPNSQSRRSRLNSDEFNTAQACELSLLFSRDGTLCFSFTPCQSSKNLTSRTDSFLRGHDPSLKSAGPGF